MRRRRTSTSPAPARSAFQPYDQVKSTAVLVPYIFKMVMRIGVRGFQTRGRIGTPRSLICLPELGELFECALKLNTSADHPWVAGGAVVRFGSTRRLCRRSSHRMQPVPA